MSHSLIRGLTTTIFDQYDIRSDSLSSVIIGRHELGVAMRAVRLVSCGLTAALAAANAATCSLRDFPLAESIAHG